MCGGDERSCERQMILKKKKKKVWLIFYSILELPPLLIFYASYCFIIKYGNKGEGWSSVGLNETM